ncbi:MAG: acetyl-/propionyl-CoA carboxylase subunit alpha, partial [Propionibacteriaceae bacterium]|nr:acetyl-/propionyl-CoA carboxylase subunit alpha [Propionibacteriaceae bacterium]
LGFDDPEIIGHAIEFRLNAEDAGRKFMPSPGTLEGWRLPTGPGVRTDEGYRTGMSIPGAFDSLVAKIIVRGADRDEAIARSRRALLETRIDGMPSVLPFHRELLKHPDFLAPDGDFRVHTTWIENDFDVPIAPYSEESHTSEPDKLNTFFIEINGKRVELRMPAAFMAPPAPTPAPKVVERVIVKEEPKDTPDSGSELTAPLHGSIFKIVHREGRYVNEGDQVIIMEAMKMKLPLLAHRSGKVVNVTVSKGDPVESGQVLCNIVA